MSLPSNTFVLTKTVYAKQAIMMTREVFREHCTVSVNEILGELCVTINPSPGAPPIIAQEFLNYALNLSIEAALI